MRFLPSNRSYDLNLPPGANVRRPIFADLRDVAADPEFGGLLISPDSLVMIRGKVLDDMTLSGR